MTADELAVAYMRAGVAVLPLHAMRDGRCTCGRPDCHSPAKHPLTRNGKDDATLDVGQLAEWLGRWPWCNVGVRPPAGVVVLDVDPRNGGDVELAKLQEQHGPIPRTLTARTGSGGLHLWLSYRGPARGRLCAGVDVKTSTGYLVAPPSVHACGGTYEWIEQAPAAPAPRWVRTILNPPVRRYTAPPSGTAGLDALLRFVGDAPDGELNTRLYWSCCRAAEQGLDPEPLIEAAISKGHPERGARATAESAGRAPARKVTR